jgi:hypothetical protein
MEKIYQYNCFRKCDKISLKEVRKCGGIVIRDIKILLKQGYQIRIALFLL